MLEILYQLDDVCLYEAFALTEKTASVNPTHIQAVCLSGKNAVCSSVNWYVCAFGAAGSTVERWSLVMLFRNISGTLETTVITNALFSVKVITIMHYPHWLHLGIKIWMASHMIAHL